MSYSACTGYNDITLKHVIITQATTLTKNAFMWKGSSSSVPASLSNLESISSPTVEKISSNNFLKDQTTLKIVYLPSLTEVGYSFGKGWSNVESIYVPSLTTAPALNAWLFGTATNPTSIQTMFALLVNQREEVTCPTCPTGRTERCIKNDYVSE